MITIAFFTGEQTREALFRMGQRLDISDNIPGIYVGKNIQEIAAIIREKRPEIVMIDSIQTIGDGSNFPAYNDLKYISFMIRKLSRDYGCAFFVIGQVNHDNRQAGPTMLAHNFDVSIIMERGINDEVIVSTPTKNRVAPTGNRAVFRMTNNGLVAKSEMETGYILRYTEQSQIGMAAFMTKTNRDYSVDEITVTVGTESKKSGFTLDGSTKGHADFLVSVIKQSFFDFKPDYIARANTTEKLGRSSDLACIIAMLSIFYKKPLSVNTVFIATLDAAGKLLPLDNMRQRYKRALDQGYTQVFGPKAIGSQEALWTEAEHFTDVWKALVN